MDEKSYYEFVEVLSLERSPYILLVIEEADSPSLQALDPSFTFHLPQVPFSILI